MEAVKTLHTRQAGLGKGTDGVLGIRKPLLGQTLFATTFQTSGDQDE